jgi:hypothetical protein
VITSSPFIVTLTRALYFRIDAETVELWKKLNDKEASRVQSIDDTDKVTGENAIATVEVLPLSFII